LRREGNKSHSVAYAIWEQLAAGNDPITVRISRTVVTIEVQVGEPSDRRLSSSVRRARIETMHSGGVHTNHPNLKRGGGERGKILFFLLNAA